MSAPWRLFLALLASGCGALPVALPDDGGSDGSSSGDRDGGATTSDLALPVNDGGYGTAKGKVTLTYYWVTTEASYTGAKDTVLCDVSAKPLATVPLAFAKALALEGTGRLEDDRLLNVGGSCACSSGMTTCYIVLDQTKYPWGLGVQSRALKPYRSIAVDKTFIAIGTKVYVPELDGVQMPSSYGFLHDGCLVADDVGGGILGAHIDFFAAEKKNYTTLDGMLRLGSVTAYANPPRCP